jgi:outer membrane lipoprotein carrier protein
MKLLFTAFAFLFAGTVLQAQPCATKNTDANAKKILDAVSAKFKTYKTVNAKFTVKTENAAGKVVGTKSGTVYMKGSKYRVSITGQEIFSDGVNVWTYDKGANEVTITKFDNSATTLTPQKIFTNFYDKDFLYKYNGEKNIGGKMLQEIEMTPCDKTRAFHKVYVYVDKATNAISSTKIIEKSNNKYTYSVSSMTPNGKLDDTLFAFDAKKYPGVEIIDLR